MTKTILLVVLIGAVALILVFLGLQLLAPGDKIDQAGPGTAHVVFSADQHTVLAPGACVIVRWQVDFIRAVYIDGAPTVGAGFKQVCVDATTVPVLHVEFNDNTAADFHLDIQFLVEQPATWLLISAAMLLGLLSLYVALSRPMPTVARPQETTNRRAPRIVWVFAAIGILVTGVAVLALVSEFALRFYVTRFGTRDEQAAYLDSRAEIEARQSTNISLPFLEYGLSPDFAGQNALGYRGDAIQVPKPNGVYRIVVLGDSSTYGTFVPYDATFPYDLQTTLRSDYGDKNVEVVNGGVPGYTSWNTFVNLALRVTELQPDLVIIYEGGNDVMTREVAPDCYSGATPFLGLDPRRQLRAEPGDLSVSAIYRLLAIHFGWMHNPALPEGAVINSRISCTAATPADYAQNVEINRPVYFERNLRDMIGVAQAIGFKIMFSTWAYNPNAPDLMDYWRGAVDEHNAITTRVAQEMDALYFDYKAIAPTDSHLWSDYMHLTAQGNVGQAQAYAKFLVDQGVIDGQAAP